MKTEIEWIDAQDWVPESGWHMIYLKSGEMFIAEWIIEPAPRLRTANAFNCKCSIGEAADIYFIEEVSLVAKTPECLKQKAGVNDV